MVTNLTESGMLGADIENECELMPLDSPRIEKKRKSIFARSLSTEQPSLLASSRDTYHSESTCEIHMTFVLCEGKTMFANYSVAKVFNSSCNRIHETGIICTHTFTFAQKNQISNYNHA